MKSIVTRIVISTMLVRFGVIIFGGRLGKIIFDGKRRCSNVQSRSQTSPSIRRSWM